MNKEEELNILLNKIGRCEYMIRLLNNEIIHTMKKPILSHTNEGIEYKWNNKIMAIKQKRKGVKRYNKLKNRINNYIINNF